MTAVCLVILLTGAYPLWRAWQANRRTTLFQAVHWAIAAWAGWCAALLADLSRGGQDNLSIHYVALCLTGCAGVAVLGARRPGVTAWNFVLLGLLAVLLMPVVQGLSNLRENPLQALFLGAVVAVGVLNYLPTRLALAAVILAGGLTLEITGLFIQHDLSRHWEQSIGFSRLLLAACPWAAYGSYRWRNQPEAVFDKIWIDFRDRFGLVWGQRLREQFNRSAHNAGWPVVLRWQGLRIVPGNSLPNNEMQTQIVQTLQAMLKRFGEEQ